MLLGLAQEVAIARLRSKPEDNNHQNDHGSFEHGQRPGISKVVAQHEFYRRRGRRQEHSKLIHKPWEEASHRIGGKLIQVCRDNTKRARICMPYNGFIPKTDFAAIPGIDFRKSGYRSCVPCERHSITLIISNR
jgi:hypothetical protein